MLTIEALSQANDIRQLEFDPFGLLDLMFKSTELAGETGEVCNVAKKLERERLGIRGSRDTVEHLAEELADVVICASILANHEGIDLEKAIRDKFNATSDKIGLSVRL